MSGQHQLCSLLPTPFPAGIDLRSAAVLAKKAEIELVSPQDQHWWGISPEELWEQCWVVGDVNLAFWGVLWAIRGLQGLR